MSKFNQYNTKESLVTSESDFVNRRKLLGLIGLGVTLPQASLFAKPKNLTYKKDPNLDKLVPHPLEQISSYNNFYEFSLSKTEPAKLAQKMQVDPWSIEIDGLVDKPMKVGLEDLYKLPLQERIYRFRCVEAWSMVVPWVGFELSELIKKAGIKSTAKYVRFETLYDPKTFPDQQSKFGAISYPYTEGLTIEEAMNPLTLMAVGIYGKEIPKQNGAPVRLVVPWKYGFKSIKSIVKITLTNKMPTNTWHAQAPSEYGFYANVNPKLSHPRWSQASERVLGKFFKEDTLMFNGYAKQVAHLYKGLDLNSRRYQ